MLRCHLGRSTRRQRGLDEERLIGRDKVLGAVDKGLLIKVDGMVYDTVCGCSASKANASWVVCEHRPAIVDATGTEFLMRVSIYIYILLQQETKELACRLHTDFSFIAEMAPSKDSIKQPHFQASGLST